MESEERKGLDRRQFLRRAAIAGAAAAWAAPIIQTVAATPAFASNGGTPEGVCTHSNANPAFSCMSVCTTKCASEPSPGNECDGFGSPSGPCGIYCNISPGNQCPNANFCNPACFQCNSGTVTFTCATT